MNNKTICTLVTASVLVAGTAYGQNKPKTTQDKQGKQALRDSQMDSLTAAGDPSIAANNSTVTSSSTGTVT